MKKMEFDKIGLFAGGVLFGTAGLKILTSKDAKKAYTHTVAAVLRAKECIMSVATNAKENAEDILEDAKFINEERIMEDSEFFDDFAECDDTECCCGCDADCEDACEPACEGAEEEKAE